MDRPSLIPEDSTNSRSHLPLTQAWGLVGAGPKLPKHSCASQASLQGQSPKWWDLEVLSQGSCFPAKLALGPSFSTQKMKSPPLRVTSCFTEAGSWTLPGGKWAVPATPSPAGVSASRKAPGWVGKMGFGAEKGEKGAACSWWVPSQSRGWTVIVISKEEERGCGSWLSAPHPPVRNSPSQRPSQQ